MAKEIIAIIGATEPIGTVIAKNLSKCDYRILLFGHDETLEALAEEIKNSIASADIDCLSCLVDASWEADIIISAVSPGNEKQIAEKIKDVATQKIVVSISDLLITSNSNDTTRELQKLLPDSKVVHAGVAISGRRIETVVAGDADEAVKTVRKIFLKAGFQPALLEEYDQRKF